MIQPKAKIVDQTPVAVICKVQFENQNKKEIEFQSSLLFSNNTEFNITVCGYKVQSQGKSMRTESIFEKFGTLEEKMIPENRRKVIAPNKVFYVPLSWYLKRKSIYVLQKGRFQLLFPDIREHFNPLLT